MFKHGHSRKGRHTRENISYWNMMGRCHRPAHPRFEDYGGRGIKVCRRWRFGEKGKCGFECFLADMGPMPDEHTLERRDNDRGYSKENCYWETRKEQARNRKSTIWVDTPQGKVTLLEAAALFGIDYKTVHRRVSLGWAVGVALTAPLFMKKVKAHA